MNALVNAVINVTGTVKETVTGAVPGGGSGTVVGAGLPRELSEDQTARHTPSAQLRATHAVVRKMLIEWLNCVVSGIENVPTSGGAIIAANHRSFLDHFLLNAASPRPASFIGKKKLAEGQIGKVNVALGLIPVERGSGDLSLVETVADDVAAGMVLGIFPEGTRSRSGKLQRFKSGMGRIAALADAPVIPTGLIGTQTVWPVEEERPTLRRPETGTVCVRFGSPIVPPTDTARGRRAFTAEVFDAVAELSGQEPA